MANILIMTSSKFNYRDYNRFDVEFFCKKNRVYIIDLSYYLRDEKYLKSYIPPDLYEENNLIKVKNINQLNVFLDTLDGKTFSLFYIGLYIKEISIIKALSIRNIGYCQFLRGANIDFRPYLKKKITLFFFKFLHSFLNYNINAPDLVFYSGNKSLNQLGYKRSKRTKFIEVPSFDYLNYVELNKLKFNNSINHNDIIFIDQYWGYHPDVDNSKFIDVKYYYKNLNKFFKYITKKINKNLGIAAHPRANYKINPFDYPIIKDDTIKLIKNSKLILAHHSTAIAYAVLYNKPIIILSLDKIKRTNSGKLTFQLAKEIGCERIIIDKKYNFPKDIPKVNQYLYKKYIDNYLISSKYNSEIDWRNYLLDHINS